MPSKVSEEIIFRESVNLGNGYVIGVITYPWLYQN